jgi:hypothetical protein
MANKYGVKVLIVEHNDYTGKHRTHQLAEQEAEIPAQLAWVNHVLYAPEKYPLAAHRDIRAIPNNFPLLPPHEEKGPDHGV